MIYPPTQPTPGSSLNRPQKLSWVTIPLIVQMVLTALSIIALPLLLPFLNLAASDPSVLANAGASLGDTQAILGVLSASLCVVVAVSIGFLVLYYLTFRAVQQGKSWGRIAAIVIFILGLFNFPLGTLLGIFGLIGAFDSEVTAYCRR